MFTQFVNQAPAHVQAHVLAHVEPEHQATAQHSRISDVITREQFDTITATPAPVSARNHIANR